MSNTILKIASTLMPGYSCVTPALPDAKVIYNAHARTDIPALLAHIDEQRVTLAKVEADKAELVEALEEMVSVAETISAFAWGNTPERADGPLPKAQAALARIKAQS